MQATLHGLAGLVHLAKKPPPEHTRWKPGQSGNAAGKKKDLLTQSQVKGLISDFAKLTEAELLKVTEDPKASWTEKTLARQMMKASDDLGALNFVFDRSIGKVKETKEIILPKPTMVERLNGTAMILGAEVPQLEGEVLEERE